MGGFILSTRDAYNWNFIIYPNTDSGQLPVGESSRSMYRKKAAIATAGKTRQLRTTMNEGKYEAENNIVKFPIEMDTTPAMNLLQISIKYSNSQKF